MRISIRIVAAILIGIFCASALPAGANARSLQIAHFDVVVDVNRDATIDVVETIEVEFTGSWNGIYRTIPIRYRTDAGFNYSLFLEVESVTDRSGSELEFETRNKGHYREVKIWVPNADDTRKGVVTKYHVRNGLRFFEEHDELYWNVTGDEWDFPILKATATVNLPSGATQVRAAAYTGVYGSRDSQAGVHIDGNTVSFATTRALSYREGMTAVVGWEKGLIDEPGLGDKIADFFRSNWPLGIPLLVGLLMFRVWRKHGRDPKLRPIAVRYEPPADMTPAEAGTLIDNSADMRDITASIVDLAVKGFVVIEEVETEKLFGLFSSQDYVFHSVKPATEWAKLRPHETKLLNALFKSGAVPMVQLSDLENKFYSHISGIRDDIFDALLSRKYYRKRPDTVQASYIFMGLVLGGLMLAFGLIAGNAFGIAPVTAIVAAIGTALAIAGFGVIMPARTNEGARVLEGVLGFSEFIERVDSDKYERIEITPDMFERFLPFAMAFGLEKRWASAFKSIATEPPSWYRGSNLSAGFQPYLFAASLNQMSTRASQTLSSSPRSKGGSGFSGGGGGGSSGGGFGGGGGGGF